MLILIVIFGALLRLISLYHAGSFWFDETFTLYFARMPWREAWQYLQFENNPPLHFFLARILVRLFGEGEILLRLSSIVMSVATIPLVYALGKKIYSHQAGLMAAALFAVSGLNIFNAVEFRMYPLLILLTGASIYYFLNYIETKKRTHFYFLVIINTALLLTQVTGVVVLAIETGYLFWRLRMSFWRWCLWQAIPVFVFLIWWLPSFLTRAVGDIANAWYFREPLDPFFFFKQLYAFLIFPSINNFPGWLMALMGMGLLLVLLRSLGKITYIKEGQHVNFVQGSLRFGGFLLSLALVPILIGSVLNVQIPKQYSISLMPFLLLLGTGISEIIQQKKFKFLIVFFSIGALLVLNYPAVWRKPYALDKLVVAIEKESGSQTEILAAAHIYTLPLNLYYHGALPVKPIYFGADSADDNMRLVRHNWHINYYSKEDLDRFLTSEAKNYTTMLVVGTTHWQNEGDIVRAWFMNHGWRLARTYSWEGYFNPDLHVFQKISK